MQQFIAAQLAAGRSRFLTPGIDAAGNAVVCAW